MNDKIVVTEKNKKEIIRVLKKYPPYNNYEITDEIICTAISYLNKLIESGDGYFLENTKDIISELQRISNKP